MKIKFLNMEKYLEFTLRGGSAGMNGKKIKTWEER